MNIGDTLVAALGEGCSASEAFGEVTVDVPPDRWVEAVTAARDVVECRFFDWLSAVDEGDEGFSLVCHVWSVEQRQGVLLRTIVPAGAPHLATVTGVFAGAGWHERETYEMFGIVFDGHPHLVPLLLPDGFEGHPLRKDFVLASRVAKEWPGAREPGESSAGGPVRRRMRPPGVPDPADWGPAAVPAPTAAAAATAPATAPAGDARPSLTDAGTAPSPSGSPEPPVPPGTSDPNPSTPPPTLRDQDPGKPAAPGAAPTFPGSPEGVLGTPDAGPAGSARAPEQAP